MHTKSPSLRLQAKGIAVLIYEDIVRGDLFKHAYALAYIVLFSIIPFLAATFSLISLFQPIMGKESGFFSIIQNFILEHLATGSGEQVVSYLENFLQNLDMTKIGATGFAGLIVSLVMFLNQIEDALNRIWLVPKARSLFMRFIYFWTFVTLGGFLLSVVLGVVSGFDPKNLTPFTSSIDQETFSQGRKFLTNAASLGATYLFFFLLYKIVPNCYVPYKPAAFGALIATILIKLASGSYGLYVSNFMSGYKVAYGALAAIPFFLFWLYVNSMIILFGAIMSHRFHLGFETKNTLDSDKPDSSQERFRNQQLQLLTPLLILILVHKRFKQGHEVNYSGQELVDELLLPGFWITEGLCLLVDENYLAKAATEKNEETKGDMLLKRYYPTRPADQITLSSLTERWTNSTHQWLKEWSSPHAKELRDAVKTISGIGKKELSQKTLAELI
jgi:membrane protein